LTGCAMRAEGLRRFRAELRRADRLGTSLAVLMLDLDHFKNVNDRFGHHTGDAVLSAVGQTLLKSLRASDVRCRWGGEEFLLVLPDSSLERARRTSDKLRQRIAETPVRAGDHVIHVTASIGITMTRAGERDLQQCLMRADRAMYQAKNLGRNRISVIMDAPPVDTGRTADTTPPHGERRGARESAPPPGGQWTGPERRDATRLDRRRFPGPGRRASDTLSFADPERVV
jgi:diguanylate cyclase (GGDEF)-like protein